MSFTDHFEQAFCINLDKRKDKWNGAKKQFKSIGIKVERVSGIDGFLEPPANIRPGEVGCLKSHLKVFQIAKERGLKSFLMLEDDVEFAEDFNDKFNQIEASIPSYEMLYLGINPHTGRMNEVAPGVFRIMNAYSAHCVVFKEPCYDDVINSLSGALIYPVDVQYGELQIKHTAYSLKPPLASQRKSFSDINQEYVDYYFLKG